ncbi:efflux RND transporter periplasmic adaptor subunit [Geitlerinema sp. PCC 9228]|uniref:efflux RND transporter periplasmic adaptor subunit n=1 Tax=Geitlerinema sp. PCC 9228 TaxID=111611 RepID=UPI0009FD1342|nr:efflux RND transporter periplasmic adaptor subunit [Geitlerinema sp. PCC 9228]
MNFSNTNNQTDNNLEAEVSPANTSTEAANTGTTAETSKPSTFGKRVPKWIFVAGAAILVTGAGLGIYTWQARQQTPATAASEQSGGKPRGTPVKLETVEPSSLEETSEFVGTLEAQQSVAVRAETNGRIVEIYVEEGDRVRSGQSLARLDSREVQADLRQAKANLLRTKAQLAEAQAGPRVEEIAQARARLEQAEARLENAKAGAQPEEIAQAQARVESAQAQAELAKARVERYRQLESEGAVSKDTLDEFVREFRQAQANLEEARRNLQEIQKGQNADVDELAAQVAEQREELRELENGTRAEEIARLEAEVADARAQVQAREVQLQDTIIKASFAGEVGDIPVDVGDYLQQGDEFTNLIQNQLLFLRMSIPAERSDQLQLGLPVRLYDSDNQLLKTGKIRFISPQVNTDSQTILVKAAFENTKGNLRDGQFVRGEVIWEKRENTFVVPTNAVIFSGDKTFIYVAQEGETLTAKKQPVQLGLTLGDRAEVVQGLQSGDRIVVSGTQKIGDGAPLMPLGAKPKDQQPSSQ